MDRIKHLSTQEIDKLIEEDKDITIKGYIELCNELVAIAESELPVHVKEYQKFRGKWNRIRNQQKEKV